MSKFVSTTFGKISGRHGTAVGADFGGESVLRVFTAPGNPKTPAQLAQRAKFAMITALFRPLRSITAIGFGNRNGMYNASSIGLRTAVKGSYPNFSVDYSKIVIASGDLPKSATVSFVKGTGNEATISWDTEVWNTASPGDLVHIAFIEESENMTLIVSDQLKREAGSYNLTYPAIFGGKVLHGWIFFVSPDGEKRSGSQYIGSITL